MPTIYVSPQAKTQSATHRAANPPGIGPALRNIVSAFCDPQKRTRGRSGTAIQLKSFLWDLKPYVYEDLFTANATGSATASHAQVVYNNSTGTLWFGGNGKGSGGQTPIASFETLGAAVPELTANDIIFL